jgi:hypothetical protein
MGWSFGQGQKKAELIRERTTAQEWKAKDGTKVKDVILAHCYRGGRFSGVFYAVHERTRTLKGASETERWLEVTLMKCSGGDWGYKDMEESMGPCEVSCPLGYLEMVPEKKCPEKCEGCAKDSCSGLWARRWRERVRAYHAERDAARTKAKALTPGTIVQLKEGCSPRELVIVSTKPLIGESGGRQYRFKARQLA